MNTHEFAIKVEFANRAYGIICTPLMRWCDIDSWLYYMGVRKWKVIMVDNNDYSEKWREVHIDKDTTGQEILHPGKNFFLSDLAKIWNYKMIK